MHRDMTDADQFARNADEAWRPSWKFRMRNIARRQALRWADQWHHPDQPRFVRCLYSHAIFPEHQDRWRTIVRSLKQTGEFIDTPTLIEILASGREPDGRLFHLSFDDGFANVFEQGGPILADEQVPYTVFIATDLIGADLETMEAYNRNALKYGKPVRPMTWDQVRACAAAGGEIGCHTRSHARLSAISGDLGSLGRRSRRGEADHRTRDGRSVHQLRLALRAIERRRSRPRSRRSAPSASRSASAPSAGGWFPGVPTGGTCRATRWSCTGRCGRTCCGRAAIARTASAPSRRGRSASPAIAGWPGR